MIDTQQAAHGQTFADALAQIDEWIRPAGVQGAGAAVWHHGTIVAERYAGGARPGVATNAETLFPLASVTKPISAAAVMTLVDRGFVSLDEPVAPHLLEFVADPAAPATDPALEALRPTITLRQLLAHTSGLPEDLGPRHLRYADKPSLDALTDAMCRLPLQSAPGAQLRYSNAGFAVLARLAGRLSAEPFWDLARRDVLDPLGLADVVAQPDPSLEERIATLADTLHPGTDVETYNSPYWRDLALPWGGLYGTPRDLARFAGSFLPSGAALGSLSLPTRAEMIEDQAGGVPGGVESGKVHWEVAHWGLGWEVKGTKRRHWTGDLTSSATFCHFGQAGTLLWGDPERDLALAVFANRAVTRAWSFFLARWMRLSDALVAAADV